MKRKNNLHTFGNTIIFNNIEKHGTSNFYLPSIRIKKNGKQIHRDVFIL